MRGSQAWKLIIYLIVAVCTVSVAEAKFTLLKTAPSAINVPDYSDNLWKSQVIRYPDKIDDSVRYWTTPDFFEQEFGKKLSFASGNLSSYDGRMNVPYKVSNGWLEFNTGKKGGTLEFGSPLRDKIHPSICFSSGWGPRQTDALRLEMKMEQNIGSSEWVFSIATKDRLVTIKKFSIKGQKQQTCEINLCSIRKILRFANITMIQLKCLTPNANMKIRSIRLGPSTMDCFWRKELNLNFKPVFAQVSFNISPHYSFYINGRKVCSERLHDFRSGLRTIDISKFLCKGKNTIAFRSALADADTSFLIEGVAIGKNGQLAKILGDKSWRCNLTAASGWERSNFNAASWKTPKTSEYALYSQGKKTFTGLNPAHMGLLQTAPVGQPFPVFDYNSKRIEFTATFPSWVDAVPELSVVEHKTGKVVERVKSSGRSVKGNFTQFTFSIKTRKTGPYLLRWQLKKGNRKLDKHTEELIIAGPIPQEELELADFEAKLNKRLKLIKKIDCTAKAVFGREFLSHNSNSWPCKTVPAPVVSRDGLSYRETGKNLFDWFGYVVEFKELGKPYMIEVVVPDNAERYIYSGLTEVFPILFCNNGSGRGWYNSTGTCYTGGVFPLSGGMKKLRYIVFPSSRISSIVIKNGLVGKPAAAAEINIYSIKGGLPALKLPQTDRGYGYHLERFNLIASWCSENPLELDYYNSTHLRVNAWYNWYKTFERKIKYLRYQGHNMTVEGCYMYRDSFVSSDFDPVFLFLKMYAHNNIKCLLGVEYMTSPEVLADEAEKLSDRKIHAGARGLYEVTRYGRQTRETQKGGNNFLSKKAGKYFHDLVKNIYRRYDGIGKPLGMFIVNGWWWAPCFPNASNCGLADTDIGYSDDTIELFEKDTGITLGIPCKGADRFAKRYSLLMGKYRKQWLKWRADVIYRNYVEIEKIISSGKDKWTLFVHPRPNLLEKNPFSQLSSSVKARDVFWNDLLSEMGMDPKKYSKDQSIEFALPLYLFKRVENDSRLLAGGINNNRGTAKLIKQADCIYMGDAGLNEIGTQAAGAETWIWRAASVGVFVTRPLGDFAYSELVSAIKDYTPKYIFNAWLDVNMDTGHGDQCRRFCKAFFVTPEAEFNNISAFGVVAQTAVKDGNAYLRLVNSTPYSITGTVHNGSELEDLVYDKVFNSNAMHNIIIRPYSIRIFRSKKQNGENFKCHFNFDRKVAESVFLTWKNLRAAPELTSKIPASYYAIVKKKAAKKDAPGLWLAMNNYEVSSKCKKLLASKEMLVRQKKLMEQLKKEGRCRINCAALSDYTDLDGKEWLADQAYTGFGAYGNEYAIVNDRGNMKIENTRAPRVYCTEAGGKRVYYYVPLAKGTYNVYIHIAETWPPNRESGRLFSMRVNGKTHKNINPLTKAGGFAKPAIEAWKNVKVRDGMLCIEAWGGVGLNGIEIEKIK